MGKEDGRARNVRPALHATCAWPACMTRQSDHNDMVEDCLLRYLAPNIHGPLLLSQCAALLAVASVSSASSHFLLMPFAAALPSTVLGCRTPIFVSLLSYWMQRWHVCVGEWGVTRSWNARCMHAGGNGACMRVQGLRGSTISMSSRASKHVPRQ